MNLSLFDRKYISIPRVISLILFTFILLPSHFLFSSDPDSLNLETILTGSYPDTLKINKILAQSENLYTSDPKVAIEFATKALDLSFKNDYLEGIAKAYKFIGLGHYFQGEYFETIQNWENSLVKFEQIGDKTGVANMLNNLGAVYNNEGDDTRALDLYLRSLKVAEEVNDTLRIVTAMVNVGLIYQKNTATQEKAMQYYQEALPICTTFGFQDAYGTVCLNLGEIYFANEQYDLALSFFEKSHEALSLSGNIFYPLINIGKVYARKGNYSQAIEYQKEAYRRAEQANIKHEMVRALLGLAETFTMQKEYNKALDCYRNAENIAENINANYELKTAYEGLASSYSALSDFFHAFQYQKLLTSINDTLYNSSKDKKLQALQFNFDIEKKEGEINLLKKDKELQEMIIQKKNIAKNASLIGLLLILIIVVILIRSNRQKIRANRLLDREKIKTEGLLLNILPAEVAKELHRYGAAVPRYYESVSVLFTDFKGFTMLAEKLSPKELVCELNDIFIGFDEIIERYGLEKIKTIGDAYMCAGGVPVANNDHPIKIVKAGLEMLQFIKDINEESKVHSGMAWGLRIGIHTGPVIAGVVGKKKYAYDIWGNTVNIASRMESSGEAGRLNISEMTHKLVKEHFVCSHRGKIYAKNVGDLDMYFVDGEREYSEAEKKFLEIPEQNMT